MFPVPGHALKRITVENSSGHSITFILEPWANEYPMGAGQLFVVEGEGPAAYADFYVESTDDCLIVWAWDGSDARILHEDGTVIEDWTGLRVPDFHKLDQRE